MTPNLQAIVDLLTRAGSKTSEGKTVLSIVLTCVLVIGCTIIQQLAGLHPENGTLTILGALAGLIMSSKWYLNQRAEVKTRVAELLQNPMVSAVIQQVKPEEQLQRPIPGELSPSSRITPHSSLVTHDLPLPSWAKTVNRAAEAIQAAETIEEALAPFRVTIDIPGEGTEEVRFIDRGKAAEFADLKRNELKATTPGARVTVY
jgi:hypothetical protein